MQTQTRLFRAFAFAAGLACLFVSAWASADPPSRVARLGYTSGAVSFSPAGENDWVQATINRPLTTGDRLWTDAGARAELQVGGAMLRMSAGTSVAVLNLDDSIAQLQLTQGTLNLRVRRLDPNQIIEIDTPNLAFTVRQPGEYRIGVDVEGNATDIYVRKGQGDVYGEGASYFIDSRQPYRFTGTGLRDYELLAVPGFDEFDRWAMDRDRSYETSVSARYVSPDVIGYQDLDANGTWRPDATYGNVWFPTRVDAGWAPYRDGHWAWVDPWGWTWVDDAPWGFAVSHYGRWSNFQGRWGWVPGPVRSRAYYAPALVAFVGGSNFQLTISSGAVGGIAWFPLGPREVYRPSYPVSRGYFERVNVSNTVINTTVINNYYNNTNVTNINYVNRQVPGAIVAVPTTAFVQSQQVNRSAVRVTREMVASAPVAAVAAVAPTERSVRGAAAQGGTPPARVFERPVIARTAPPPASAGFAAQQQQLQAQPGKPVEESVRRGMKKAASAEPAPVVNVVAQPKATPPNALPPPAGMAGRGAEGRGKAEERKGTTPGAVSGAPGTPATSDAPRNPLSRGAPSPQVAQPAVVPQPQDQRGKDEQRGKGQQRGAPGQATQPAPQAVMPATTPATPPQAVAKPPVTAPVGQPGKSDQAAGTDQRQKGEQRGEQRGNPLQRGQPATASQGATPAVTPAPAPQAQPARTTPQQPQFGKGPSPQPSAQSTVAVPPQAAAPPQPAAQVARPQVRPDGTPATRQAPGAVSPAPPQAAPPAQPQAVPPAPQGRGKGQDKDKKKDDEDEKAKQKS